MRRTISMLVAAGAMAGAVAFMSPASGQADGEAAPIFGIKLPAGYRDWQLISVAREEGKLDDLRAIPGNDIAIEAAREGTLPYPDGTIIARIAWSCDPPAESEKAFGYPQSFVAGAAKNGVQFMVKDSKKYASTGAGDSLSSTTATPPPRRSTRPAFPATRSPRPATSSSTVMHLEEVAP